MKTESISFILFITGIAYMAIDGWLVSWWFVPESLMDGPAFLLSPHFTRTKPFSPSGHCRCR